MSKMTHEKPVLSRRDFLRLGAIGSISAVAVASGCGPLIAKSHESTPTTTPITEATPFLIGNSEVSGIQNPEELEEAFKKAIESSEYKEYSQQILENTIPFRANFPRIFTSIDMVGVFPLETNNPDGSIKEIGTQLWVRKDTEGGLEMVPLTPVFGGEEGKEENAVIWVEPNVVKDGKVLSPAEAAEEGYGVSYADLDGRLAFKPPSWLRDNLQSEIGTTDYAFISVPLSQSLTPTPDLINPTHTPTVGDIQQIAFRSADPIQAEPTPEVKQFKVCQIENFRDCPITYEDIMGPYWHWLNTLSKPFPENVRNVPLFLSGNRWIVYDLKTIPNFLGENALTAPFRRDVTAAHLNHEGKDYLVQPIEYYDPSEPDRNKWVITVYPLFNGDGPYEEEVIQQILNQWKNEMRITIIQTTPTPPNLAPVETIVSETFASHPDMDSRFKRFLEGDHSSLSEPGLIVFSFINFAKGPNTKYK